MEALILDGSNIDDRVLNYARGSAQSILNQKGYKINTFVLRDIRIAPCLGCFDCWLKTPGVCVINDHARKIVSVATKCDLWIFITPITFGGYSSELKKGVDRLLPIFVPVFTNINGEVHHMLRYENRPAFIGIGRCDYAGVKLEKIFKSLVGRNAINFKCRKQSARIISSNCANSEIEEVIRMSFAEVDI